jgi:hypothetical protein
MHQVMAQQPQNIQQHQPTLNQIAFQHQPSVTPIQQHINVIPQQKMQQHQTMELQHHMQQPHQQPEAKQDLPVRNQNNK